MEILTLLKILQRYNNILMCYTKHKFTLLYTLLQKKDDVGTIFSFKEGTNNTLKKKTPLEF